MNDGEQHVQAQAQPTLRDRLKVIGPGLVLAALGVGAGDMVVGLENGSRVGTALMWAVVLGAIIKYTLTEGLSRYYLATGQTLVEGWHSLGRWASGFVLLYLVILVLQLHFLMCFIRPERLGYPGPQPFFAPSSVLTVDRLPWSKLFLRNVTPASAGVHYPQHPAQYLARIAPRTTYGWLLRR